MTFEMTTVADGAACAAGAVRNPASSAAAATRGIRKFTLQESFPRGNPRETAANVSLLQTKG
jgi:hypothetical protein